MAAATALRWILTGLFGVTFAYCLARCVGAGRAGRHPVLMWLVEIAHVAMSVSMIAMLWAVGWDRWGVQLTIFAVLGGCFAVLALPVVQAPHDGTEAAVARPVLIHEATVMAAMCWMLGAAPPGNAMAAMAGMAAARPPAWSVTVTAALIAALTVSTWLWVRRRRRAPTGHAAIDCARGARATLFGVRGETASQLLMAAGMATSLTIML